MDFSPLCAASLSEMRHNCLPFFFSTPPRFSHFPIHAVIVSNKQRVWTQKGAFWKLLMNIQSGLSREMLIIIHFLWISSWTFCNLLRHFLSESLFCRKEENLYIHKYILSNLRLIGKLPDETKKRRCGFSNNRKTIKIY